MRMTARTAWFCLATLIRLPLTAPAQDYLYSTNSDSTLSISAYNGPGGDITIPDSANGLSVTRIDAWAFEYCTNVFSVTIPDGITNIGAAAFIECINMTNIVIGKGVVRIGGDLFDLCYKLLAISVNPTNPAFCDVSGVLFSEDQTTLIQYPGGKAGPYTIPDSVTTITDAAFAECYRLTDVTIPTHVTDMGSSAFHDCTSLTNVTIPASVTNIGSSAFSGCSGLRTIAVDTNNVFYGSANGALFEKHQFTLIKCPEGMEGTYTIPEYITAIGYGAFFGCSSLTAVTLGSSVATIGAYAFHFCTNLTSITIPASVTNIGDYALNFGTSLPAIYFTGNAPIIGTNICYLSTTICYLPGTTGWNALPGGYSVALWNPTIKSNTFFGVQTNCFVFTVTGPVNTRIIVEACTNLACPVWFTVSTQTLTGGNANFSDSQWASDPSRFYRFRAP